VASGKGVEASSIRLVGLAVTGLVVVDPLLVHRLGFQLSVAATVGIALGSARLASWLPGPRFLREALATTIAAQAAVAPLLVSLGGMSPVAVPANLLAVPAAGPVMVWGLTGGFAAGVTGGPIAGLVHGPSRLLLAWLAGVARVAADTPLRPVGLLAMVASALFVGAAVLARAGVRRVFVIAAALAFVVPSATGALTEPGRLGGDAPTTGLVLWRDAETTVAVVAAGDPARVLGGLRRREVGRIDLLVVDGSGVGPLGVVAAVLSRHEVTVVAGPARLNIAGLHVLASGDRIRAGAFVVTADAKGHPTVTMTGGR